MTLDPSSTRWQPVQLAGGGTAWRLDEPEAPGLCALAGIDGEPPRSDRPVSIAIYDVDAGKAPHLSGAAPVLLMARRFEGEAELRDWYAEKVGHRADDEPLPRLLELVAASMLFDAPI